MKLLGFLTLRREGIVNYVQRSAPPCLAPPACGPSGPPIPHGHRKCGSVKEEAAKTPQVSSHFGRWMRRCGQPARWSPPTGSGAEKVMYDQLSTTTPTPTPQVQDHTSPPAEALGAEQSIGTHRSPVYKRPFDVLVATVLLVVTAPVAAVVALTVKLTSPGPILFRQERLGQYGCPFTLYKFRTMYHGAGVELHREYFGLYRQGIRAPGQPRPLYKLRRDPRITPLGGILRRLALDELPQLYNVLRGDMSVVGPRPPLRYEVEHYTQRDLLRLSVKPGITGLWQVRGRDVVDFDTMITLDLEYIHRQSLALDLWILLATLPALVWAYIKH
jgi:lipopolysaccharide/colanic/teichoic acid biosynthesis glycosyltransferase